MSTEIVELKEFPGYGVDREGNVYSLERVVPHPKKGAQRIPFQKLCPFLSGSGYHTIYLYIRGKRFLKRVHRLVAMAFLGLQPGQDVDHINRDRADNRLVNLRLATKSQNLCNSPKRGSGLKGATRHRQRWNARVAYSGVQYNLGSYATEAEAHAAYCKAAKELHGEFYYDLK